MHKKYLSILSGVLLLCLLITACASSPANNANNNEQNTPTEEPTLEPTKEPTPLPTETPTGPEMDPTLINLVEFGTDDGVFHILYPEGWATNQVPLDTGLAFGIAPLAEHFSAGPLMFNEPIIMVYGSVEQVPAELALVEDIDKFHNATFYGDNSIFDYIIVGEPQVFAPTQYVTYYLTQAQSVLPTGVFTDWMLGTALADQTVISFAVGLPSSAMEQYGDLAMQMFNSVEIDTEVTGQMATP